MRKTVKKSGKEEVLEFVKLLEKAARDDDSTHTELRRLLSAANGTIKEFYDNSQHEIDTFTTGIFLLQERYTINDIRKLNKETWMRWPMSLLNAVIDAGVDLTLRANAIVKAVVIEGMIDNEKYIGMEYDVIDNGVRVCRLAFHSAARTPEFVPTLKPRIPDHGKLPCDVCNGIGVVEAYKGEPSQGTESIRCQYCKGWKVV